MWQGRGVRPGRGRGGNAQHAALLMMLARNIQQLDRKPPLTLGLIGVMYYLHFLKNAGSSLDAYRLCPDRILDSYDLSALVISAFLHVDEWHVYHNMLSFLWKGYNLESRIGSIKFAFVLLSVLLLSHTLVVFSAYLMAAFFNYQGPLHQCSIGFSCVLFALKVLLNHSSPSHTNVYGFRVPTKYAAWLELVVIHLLVPRTSFLGHMCGILAGYVYLWSPGFDTVATYAAAQVQRMLQSLVTPPQQDNQRSDADIARQMQEEEYRRAQPRPEAMPPPTSDIHELRRRRLARFE